MAKKFRAKVQSYGFRGKYWDVGEIAENVKDEEQIALSVFEEIIEGAPEPQPEPADTEPNTLSQMQTVAASSKGRKKVFGK